MDMTQLMQDFKQSVYNLADNLPQWSSDDIKRRKTAAVSSMFEECGEICGLVSKYQTRKIKGTDLWLTDFESLPDETKATIIEKFKDETGDFLWVVTAAIHSVLKDKLDICDILNGINSISNINIMEQLAREFMFDVNEDNSEDVTSTLCIHILSELMDDIRMTFSDDNNDDEVVAIGHAFMSDICALLVYLKLKYDISLEDILLHNMEKLGVRYDENGNRVDGKL